MRLCCLLLSRPRPAKTFTGVIPWFGDKLGFYRGITLALSFGTFPYPLYHILSLSSLKNYRRDVSTLHFGKGVVSKKRQLSKQRAGIFWQICKHRSAIENTNSNRFGGALAENTVLKGQTNDKKTLEEVQIVS